MQKKIKRLIIVVSCCLFLIVIGEVVLRACGFGNAVLYYNNEYTGYNLQPNQECVRLGKTIITNEISMRSDSLDEEENRILMFGDSVLNGGSYTDHTKLASTMLENTLKEDHPNIRVLNVSCGGWGIDNCYGYLQQYGDLGAKVMVLVFSNHDAVGTISDRPIAGTLLFPDRQYRFAWQELFERYLLPKVGIYVREAVDSTNTSVGNDVSSGWENFYQYTQQNGIQLIIYLHAQRNEVEEFSEYNYNGKRIIAFAEEHEIPLYTDIDYETVDDFRDWIHLTEDGQHVIYDILLPVLYDSIR